MSNPSLDNLPEVSFIENLTIEELQKQMIKDFQDKYKEITGQDIELDKADPYRLILYSCSLQQYQAMQYIDIQGKKNLIKYSSGGFLDQVAALRGIQRSQGSKALTKLKFTLSGTMESNVSIPVGTRVAGGNSFFATKEYAEITAGEIAIEVDAECTVIGSESNGLLPGEINSIVDSIPYVETAVNITESDGGTDIESDDSLAERIYLAPSSYSVAGPSDAYVYFAKEYNPMISDVKVTSPSPAVVDIRIILSNGNLPDQDMIDGLLSYLSAETRRPLTESVTVAAPDTVDYGINVNYYINESDKNIATTIQNRVNSAVESYKAWQDSKIGRDINPSYLIHQMMAAGAKRVEVTTPVFQTVTDTDIPQCSTTSIVYGGIEDD